MIGNVPVLIHAGRLHYYEGYDIQEVCFYVLVLKLLGVKKIIITNAVGSANPHIEVGDIVLITDHINMFSQNPLRGKIFIRKGLRFPDMSSVYDSKFISLFKNEALKLNIKVKEGIY